MTPGTQLPSIIHVLYLAVMLADGGGATGFVRRQRQENCASFIAGSQPSRTTRMALLLITI
jgi:hypothetical protein